MYSRIPCALPSAVTPINADSLANYPTVIGAAMSYGYDSFKEIIEKLGGVWPGSSAWGDTAAGGGSSSGTGTRGAGVLGPGKSQSCGGVVLQEYPGSYMPPAPVLVAPPPAAVLTPPQARAVTQPAPAPAIPASDPPICMNINAETVCEAAQRGCFAAGQVDQAQLMACASAGWQGNRNEFPYVVARGGANGGARVGLLNRNPRGPGGRMSEAPWMGLNGLGCGGDGGSSVVAVIALTALGLGGIFALSRGMRG